MCTVFLCWDLKMVALSRIRGRNRKILKIGQVRIKISHLRMSEASSIDQNFNSCQFHHLSSVLNGVPDCWFNVRSFPIHGSLILL